MSSSKNTKILFLDIDGVLNHRGMDWKPEGAYTLCPERVAMMKALIEELGLTVVLSTSWATSESHVKRLREVGLLDRCHEDLVTPRKPSSIRGQEIKWWLDNHPEVTEYAIVDDFVDTLMEATGRVVRTDFDNGGLRPNHTEAIRAIFNQPLQELAMVNFNNG